MIWVLFFALPLGFGFLAAKNNPTMVPVAVTAGLALWFVVAAFAWIGGAASTNHCREYGYPSLNDTQEGKPCPDADLRYFIHHH